MSTKSFVNSSRRWCQIPKLYASHDSSVDWDARFQQQVDLAAVEQLRLMTACSDEHYGNKANTSAGPRPR
ncbi:hypothetical protein OK016_29485 [Vibrio chagasii]|nr:hypothetical protein [Vibrio chagasii]